MLRNDLLVNLCYNYHKGCDIMPKNYLLVYSEQLATDIELLCENIKAPSNTISSNSKSSSSVYANIREANYGQCGRIRRMLISSCKTLKENIK